MLKSYVSIQENITARRDSAFAYVTLKIFCICFHHCIVPLPLGIFKENGGSKILGQKVNMNTEIISLTACQRASSVLSNMPSNT